MLKILQARLQPYMNQELPDVQAGFRKGRGTRGQIANIRWIIEQAREFQKKLLLLHWLHQSLWLWITTNWKILQGMGIPDHLTGEKSVCLLRNLYAGLEKSEPDMKQHIGSKLGKGNVKVVYCHPAYLTYMQSTSCEMLDWMKNKLESRLSGEISINSNTQMTPPLWHKVKRN